MTNWSEPCKVMLREALKRGPEAGQFHEFCKKLEGYMDRFFDISRSGEIEEALRRCVNLFEEGAQR